MMTYIRMKPWVSNRMNFVIVQVSRSYRLLVCGIIPILTIAVLAPIIDHNSVRGYVEVSFGVALLSPIVLCVCKRKNAKHQVPLCYCNTTLGSRHCIVGSEWIEHWWLLGTHHATRSCWQGQDLFSRPSITMWCWSLAKFSLLGSFEDSGWLTLPAKWCSWGKKVELCNCTLIVTMCVQCGYCTRSNK